MFFRGGAAVLDTKTAGIERVALAVATEASAHYPKEKLRAALERMNTRLGENVTNDYSTISVQCVKQHTAESWKIFADVILNPAFDPADLELERQRILSALRQAKDIPDQYLTKLAMQSFYGGHPYAIDVQGTELTVPTFTADGLRAFFKGRVTATQMLLVAVGNMTRQDLEGMVRESFAGIPAGSLTVSPLPSVRHEEPSIKVVKRTLPTNYIVGYFPIPAFGTPEGYSMMVAGAILRDRLFEQVRTKRGLSYAPSAGTTQDFVGHGQVYVSAVSPDTTIKVMLAEVERLKTEAVPAKKLNEKVNEFLTRYYLGMEATLSQAEMLGRFELSGLGYQEASTAVDRIRKVTPESLQAVCKECMRNLQFVLIGDPASLEMKSYLR
jgi:zinc protease